MAHYERKSLGTKDEDLLKEIRDRYTYGVSRWEPTRQASEDSLRCLTSEFGPWPQDEIVLRLKPIASSNGETRAKRPLHHSDILSQYPNRSIGRLRQFKRGIKITPIGIGGDEETAERRESRIRSIEYDEKAWQARYWAANCQRRQGYGAWKLSIERAGPRTMKRKIAIWPIPNPDAVVIDPDTKMPDRSDMEWAFEVDRYPLDKFKREFGENAERVSFAAEDLALGKDWIGKTDILVANHWKVDHRKAKLLVIRTPKGAVLPDGQVVPEDTWSEILQEELDKLPDEAFTIMEQSFIEETDDTEIPEVYHYVTNGVEILDESKLPWSTIPLIFLPGREEFRRDSYDKDSGELVLESMIYKAIPAQLTYDFALTNQIESAGQIPKTKFLGYTGQFHGDNWANAHRDPTAYLEADPVLEGVGGDGTTPLPLPQVIEFRPPIDLFEIMKQAAIREAENAMGMATTEKMDRIGKSGEALKTLDAQADTGSQEFDDAFTRAIEYEGKLINEALEVIEDSQREVGLRKINDDYEVYRLEPQVDPESRRITWHPYGRAAAHSVTVSVGPTMESQQREAEDFIDKLVAHPQFGPMFIDELIRFKRLGDVGDVLEARAKAMLPPQIQQLESGELPPEAVGPVMELTRKLQEKDQQTQAMAQKLDEFEREKEGKVLDNEGKAEVERIRHSYHTEMAAMQDDTKKIIAEIKAASTEAIAAMEARLELALESEKMDLQEAEANRDIDRVGAPGVAP